MTSIENCHSSPASGLFDALCTSLLLQVGSTIQFVRETMFKDILISNGRTGIVLVSVSRLVPLPNLLVLAPHLWFV
jgi:hypothetical protein